MIAQVFRIPAAPGGGPAGNLQDVAKRQRDVDGCEGIYIVGNSSAGDILAVTLWRDEAAMRAGAGYQEEEIASAKQANQAMDVPAPTIYEVLAHA
jgi:hypothetical protein